MPHPGHPPSTKQRLPLKRSGPAVPRASSIHGTQHPSQGQRVFLRPRRGFFHRCGDGAGLSDGLHQTSDAQTAALAKTQKQGDVAALTARGLAPVAEETEGMADVKEEVLLPKVVRSVQKHPLTPPLIRLNAFVLLFLLVGDQGNLT